MASTKMVSVLTMVVATLVGLGTGLTGMAVQNSRHQRKIADLEARSPGRTGGGEARGMSATSGDPSEGNSRDTELASLVLENAQLRAKLAASGGSSFSEDAMKRVLALKSSLAGLIKAKNGAGLLKLMQELAAEGEAGYQAAMEIATMLKPRKNGRTVLEGWGLTNEEFEAGISGPVAELGAWALRNPDQSSPDFREVVAVVLYGRFEVDAASAYLDGLLVERDGEVAMFLVDGLRKRGAQGVLPKVADAVRAHSSDAYIVAGLLEAIGAVRSEEADRLLEEFAQSKEELVRVEAELALVRRRPPVAGVYIIYMHEEEGFGLKRGDIVTGYDGNSITKQKELNAMMGKKSEDPMVTFTINRRGQTLNVIMKRKDQPMLHMTEVEPAK